MRELSQDELNFVVGGTLPSNVNKPLIEQQYNILTENYFQYGVGVVGMNDKDGLWELIKRVVERLFPPNESEDRKAMMDHCASQGKSAVFISGGGAIALSADPATKSVKLESSTGQSASYCQ